jgi:hypothetical protein
MPDAGGTVASVQVAFVVDARARLVLEEGA